MNSLFVLIGFSLVSGTWLWYLALIPAEKVPQRPWVHIILMGVGLILIIAAAVFVPTLLNIILATTAVLLAGLFYYLLTIARLPDGQLVVEVGDPLPSFAAIADNGQLVDSRQWHGRRTLLKFFRGHW